MIIESKHFGEVEIDQDKVLNFQHGLLGLTEYKNFTILYDSEDDHPIISWLQSTEEKDFALPIINPLLVLEDYNPTIEDELLTELGELKEENLLVFNVVVIPDDITKMTTNLKAPIVINTDTKKGRQVIVENEDYEIKFPLYKELKKFKGKAGE
ncbi:flagellar assembly factor FliW [Natranaerovirga pectinivora]|uniref:Flagellar assembly factor FliW n=1 Tax=Natranaerovirga pectinivora TaxID=682400 RepID=A0A4R3MIK3_9FIRM|nr:flagellar assembly protein FliW [Natranaerovirga pectinivora]TCT14017.1 flagellar assembly factor FliW [Natranaerovirga pectinivora]